MPANNRVRSTPENRTLLHAESVALCRPFERQINAVEQRLGIEFCGLLPLPDRFHDCGWYERQAREMLDVALANTFVSRDLGERTHSAGRTSNHTLARAMALSNAESTLRGGLLPAAMMIRVSTPRRFILSGTKLDRRSTLLVCTPARAQGTWIRQCHPYAVVAQFDPGRRPRPGSPWNRLRFPIGGKE